MNQKNGRSLTFQEIIDELVHSHIEEMNAKFEDKVGNYRELVVDMALHILKHEKKIRAFIKYPKYSNQDLIGIDFCIWVDIPNENMKPITISVLGGKYVEKEKELHPNVDCIFPVEMNMDNPYSVKQRIIKIIEEKTKKSIEAPAP